MAEEKEKPLTREDVLKRIEENGGTAKGLDLSGKTFKDGINLRGLNLEGIILKTFMGLSLGMQDFLRTLRVVNWWELNLTGPTLMEPTFVVLTFNMPSLECSTTTPHI